MQRSWASIGFGVRLPHDLATGSRNQHPRMSRDCQPIAIAMAITSQLTCPFRNSAHRIASEESANVGDSYVTKGSFHVPLRRGQPVSGVGRESLWGVYPMDTHTWLLGESAPGLEATFNVWNGPEERIQ